MGNFVFNGISAAQMGLVVERFPSQHVPRKRMTNIKIPGRSGDLHQWDGSFENFKKRYVCWFKENPLRPGLALRAQYIKNWLLSAPAAARLEDTYEPDIYRLATYTGGAEIENVMNRFGRFTVEFDCAAPSYLVSGEEPTVLTATGIKDDVITKTLMNPTKWTSLPLVEVTGSVGGVITIRDEYLQVRFIGFDDVRTLYIDCDTREAWEVVDGVEVSRNDWVILSDYPRLREGKNTVSFVDGGTTGIKSVKIYPRWWHV